MQISSIAIALALALGWTEARVTENVLMRDAETAADKFQVATEDMDNWQRTYYETVFEFKSQMIPELVCPDPQVPIQSLAKVEQQIEKMRECRREKVEQLGVLKDIADTMTDLNMTASVQELEETIEGLNATAVSEDILLTKEEEEILGLREQIANFTCDCAYEDWGEWGDCTESCGDFGTKTRHRGVKWDSRNGGQECSESDMSEQTSCNRKCCPVDCAWEEWSEWSACPDVCGVSNRTRHREKIEHQCGGNPCEGKGTEEQECNHFDDVKMELTDCKAHSEAQQTDIGHCKADLEDCSLHEQEQHTEIEHCKMDLEDCSVHEQEQQTDIDHCKMDLEDCSVHEQEQQKQIEQLKMDFSAYQQQKEAEIQQLKASCAQTTEAPYTEAPNTEAPTTIAPSTEAPSKAPTTFAPKTEAPSTNTPATKAPTTFAPAPDAPSTKAPTTKAPATEAPSKAPSTFAPATDAPSKDSTTKAPATEAPATKVPTTFAPDTEAPTTKAAATEVPATV